jgi:hypothetical protein
MPGNNETEAMPLGEMTPQQVADRDNEQRAEVLTDYPYAFEIVEQKGRNVYYLDPLRNIQPSDTTAPYVRLGALDSQSWFYSIRELQEKLNSGEIKVYTRDNMPYVEDREEMLGFRKA